MITDEEKENLKANIVTNSVEMIKSFLLKEYFSKHQIDDLKKIKNVKSPERDTK